MPFRYQGGDEVDTPRRIMLAAREEFARKGLNGGSIEAIARRAGVTKHLVYYYFSSKAGLYEEVLTQTSRDGVVEMKKRDYRALPPLDAARAFFKAMVDSMDILTAKLALDSNFHDASYRRQKELQWVSETYDWIVDAGQETHVFHPKLDRRACFEMAVTLLSGSFLNFGRARAPATAEHQQFVDLEKRKRLAVDAILTIMTCMASEDTGESKPHPHERLARPLGSMVTDVFRSFN